MLNKIQNLRRALHQEPELSGHEQATAKRIQAFIEAHAPTEILTGLGGHGLAAIHEFGVEGPGVMIRCELDALPIQEENKIAYRSQQPGVSHKCGHDGHMAMVAGLVFWIREQEFKNGRIVLLFQPAEETGQGAAAVLEDERLRNLDIDYVFALHNIPGEPLHTILLMEQGFSAEVQSFAIQIKGKTAHAAEPEQGINPAGAIAELLTAFASLNQSEPTAADFAILTPVHLNLGEKNYGIAPAEGELHYTVRTWSQKQMQLLVAAVERLISKTCLDHQLQYELEWFEYFPASANDATCNAHIARAAAGQELPLKKRPHPFRFGEDFGWFSRHYRAAMFGLGAGETTPALHHADYDFPDDLLETGLLMFQSIIRQVLAPDA